MARQKANFEIARVARLLGVSRSGYYAWAHRKAQGLSKRARSQAVLDERVRVFHAASDGVYGASRITADLHEAGSPVNVKTVAASLRRQGLEGVSPRGFRSVTVFCQVNLSHFGS